jgi:glucosamine-6-phosphate deaminase
VTVELRIHPASRWPDLAADALANRIRERPDLRLVLPTGETPSPVYESLRRRTDPAEWARVTVIALDEYLGLPAEDPARAANRLRRELLDHVRPHRIVDAASAAEDDDAAVRSLDAAAEEIDLALVGLGMNGHVGLNEPGSDADAPTRIVELHPASRAVATDRYGAGSAPERGITIGLARLLAAAELWLLVTGGHKAAVLGRALEGPETPDCPASFLRRHPRLSVVADEPAAALLGSAP